MGKARAESAKRLGTQAVEDDILATAHGLAAALHRVGALDSADMLTMNRLCFPPRPDYSAPEIKRIRAATRMSQPVFARLLGVDKSAVTQWERGVKRPSGPALRLLEMLDPERSVSPIVQVRHEIDKVA